MEEYINTTIGNNSFYITFDHCIELYQKDFNNVELFIESITFKTQEQNFDFSYDGADTSAVGLYTETVVLLLVSSQIYTIKWYMILIQ